MTLIVEDQDLEEVSDPNQAALRVLDGFNARERLLRYLLGRGVTLVHAVPGPNTTISGQAGVFKRFADTTGEAVVRFPSAMVFNLGEGPKRVRDARPGTRMGIAALIRKALSEASQPAPEHEEGLDLNRETLRPVVNGDLLALFVAHGFENPARIAAEGTLAGITSGYESYVPKTRVVLFEAAAAVANGLPWSDALAAVTSRPASFLGLEGHGSLEAGNVADLVCYDGDPFEHTSHVILVYGDGRLFFERKALDFPR